jgi:hypothetical protein
VKLPTRPPASVTSSEPAATSQGRQARLEEAVVPAGGDVAEVERGGAGAAHAGAALHHQLEHLEVVPEVVALPERKAVPISESAMRGALGDAQPLVVEERAAALGA